MNGDDDLTRRVYHKFRRDRGWHEGEMAQDPDATPGLLENTSLGTPYVVPDQPFPLQLPLHIDQSRFSRV